MPLSSPQQRECSEPEGRNEKRHPSKQDGMTRFKGFGADDVNEGSAHPSCAGDIISIAESIARLPDHHVFALQKGRIELPGDDRGGRKTGYRSRIDRIIR